MPDRRDELYEKAALMVAREGECTISMIQRRLGIGYARASRLVDAMEAAGVVGPFNGVHPREVLVYPTGYVDA